MIKKIEESYTSEKDWEVKENANETKSFGNFLSYFLDKFLKNKNVLKFVFPEKYLKEHIDRNIHIHKLPFSLYIPYCVGWSFPRILSLGLKTPTLNSRPAKHLDAALNHLGNFIFLTAQEWTGAMAISAFDLFIAPFIKFDKLNEKEIKQNLQSFVYELNYPSRMGFQAPFSNITIVLDTVKTYLERDAIVGGKIVGKTSEYLDEAITATKTLIKIFNEGDSTNSPFTFPIPTIMITKNFDWNGRRWGELTDLIFENIAKKGTIYILNGYATNVEAIYSMCCRLTIDISKVNNKVELKEFLHKEKSLKGTWATPETTGSIGIVTINLPRLAFLSKGENDKFEDLLLKKLEIARKILQIMRKRYERSLRAGLMPMTSLYLGNFDAHYNTFGLVGLPEAAANFLGNSKVWDELNKNDLKEATKWMKFVVKFVNNFANECEHKDGVLYNVEEVPAESVAYSFAKNDLKVFAKEIKSNKFFMPMQNGTPFYSNSIVPYYAILPIIDRVKLEAEVQKEFTGGVMMHLFTYEIPDPEALKKLVRKIVRKTQIVYFSIAPTIAVCKKCGWNSIGIYENCPKCKNKPELWSRIVGYYRPISRWHVGKKAEFLKRVHYGFEQNYLIAENVLNKI